MCRSRRALAMWSQPPPPGPDEDAEPFRARASTGPPATRMSSSAAFPEDGRVARMVREYDVRVGPTTTRPPGLRVLEQPQYQNLEELRKNPEYANIDEISREFGYRLCPEGQNLEDEAIYENILSVRQLRSAEVRLVPVSEVAYYEGQGYVATQLLSRNGTFPQCPPHTWSRLQGAGRLTGSLRVFTAKREMYDVKKQRLCLAQDEYKHLNNALSTLAASRTSLCSSTTSMTTTSTTSRHDPEVLRAEVSQARGRVAQLRKELRQARAEVACARRGVDTLAEVEQKLSSQQGCYNITEAQAIMTELKNIQKSLTSGEKEKADLMQSLAKLKDDLTRLQLGEASPDLSTLSIPQEKLSTASQTDLCADLVPIGTRLAEMARVRLQYDEARKRIQQIQQQLADLEDKVQPGQAESDKDRLLLFQEKEQLLRELRSITPRTRSKQEMTDIQIECKKLEQDLKNAFEMSNKCIADRLKLHEEKQLLLQQLKDALTSMTTLEGQLKTLSASTLSVSSSSSLGSLSTASSKGSLSSGISFTDIYGGPQIASSLQTDKPIDMVDLHRRVERLLRGTSYPCGSATPAGSSASQPSLSPRSSLSSASPPPPSYTQVERQRRQQRELEEKLAEMRIGVATGLNEITGHATIPVQLQGPGRPGEPLSPISETPPPPLSPRTPSSSGTNTRSVSAAVSDESVAGDSGVFEAAQGGDASNAVNSAQIEIKLRYCPDESALEIGILRARNLHALYIDMGTEVAVRGALVVGGGGGVAFGTAALAWRGAALAWRKMQRAALGSRALRAATLQLNLTAGTECLGCAQVSLADFDADTVSQKWYNVLSFRSMRRDESSDESTVISSQTSTLTRNRGPESMTGAECNVECGDNSASEDDEAREPLNQIVEEDSFEDYIPEEDIALEEEFLHPATAEKETNTECNFCPEGARQLHRRKSQQANASNEEPLATIKRSQTFSPQPQSIGKGHYICRLNRSESDSSMVQYARRGALQPPAGIPFDRSVRERRSLRWGRVRGARAAGGGRGARTSLDLTLDLRAQHARLADLRAEIATLAQLKKRLEEACRGGGAGAAGVAAWRGEGALAAALLSHLLRRPPPPLRALAARHRAAAALLAGKWEEAELNIRQLASLDRWESQLLKAEMYFLRGDAMDALETLEDILEFCRTEDDSLHFAPLRLQAMVLMSQVQLSYSVTQSTNVLLLNEALSWAKKFHLHYLAATVEMHIANVQLHMGCAKNALLLVRKVLPLVMAHGSAYDMARGLLLYTKCRIATAPPSGEARIQVFQSCCEALESVKENFCKIGAQVRLLQTWYIQAQLYNDVGNIAARNQCAWMYRQLETQNPVDLSNMLHIMY